MTRSDDCRARADCPTSPKQRTYSTSPTPFLCKMTEVIYLQPMERQTDDKLPEIAESSNQPAPAMAEDKEDPVTLPDIQKKDFDSSTESLIKALGLVGADEKSLGKLLKTVRGQVLATLDELRTITTHDDNLEKQYKEVVSENVHLNSALEKARGEIRHLKGRLSVLHMTSSEVRQHKARTQLRERRKLQHEHQLQQSRQKYSQQVLQVLDVAERARTVNARGEYIDHRQQPHTRHSTYPPPPLPSSVLLPPSTRPRTDPLPPPLLGCHCSVCNAQQSLGALTLGSRHPSQQQQPLLSQPRSTAHLTKSGQQILLGDRVIVKGERPGVVRYIGRLESDVQGQIFIGVHLIMPVGTCDGSLRGRHYFQCPPHHGVFVRPADIMCVTGRKPCTGGTIIPRIQERVTFGSTDARNRRSKQTLLHSGPQEQKFPTPPSTRTASTMTQAHTLLQQELTAVNTMSPDDLFAASVREMSHQMGALAKKNKLKHQSTQRDHESLPPNASPTQGDTESHSKTPSTPSPPPTQPQEPTIPDVPPTEPTPSPPPPLPPSPSPPEVAHVRTPPRTPVSRAETPLQTTLLRALQAKDLGSTGFVTGNELSATLTELKGKTMSERETEQLMEELGIPKTETGGFPYNDIIPYLVEAIEGQQQ